MRPLSLSFSIVIKTYSLIRGGGGEESRRGWGYSLTSLGHRIEMHQNNFLHIIINISSSTMLPQEKTSTLYKE